MKGLFLAALVIVPIDSAIGADQIWPAIAPLHATYQWVNPEKEGVDTPFVTYIRSPSGVPLYKFECHDGDYDDESEINFSGVFQCALFALQGKPTAFTDLLAADTKDEQSTDWWNRGRVMANQLQAPCLDYPEYSTSRKFRLRDMMITLGISNIEWSSTIPKTIAPAKFMVTIDAIVDMRATKPQAAIADGTAPPKGCYP